MVLVIDDELFIREVIQESLAFVEIETISASNGREGLELFRAHQDEIDVVILDMKMPEMSGRETLQKLREISSRVPIVLASGLGESELATAEQNDAAVVHLAKPFSLEGLVETVQRALALTPPN
jgi:CheY-like chemotaxis protein